MVAGNRIGPVLASSASAASISRGIVWRVASLGFFSSISLAVGPIISVGRTASLRTGVSILDRPLRRRCAAQAECDDR